MTNANQNGTVIEEDPNLDITYIIIQLIKLLNYSTIIKLLRYRSWQSSIPLRNDLRQTKWGTFEQDLSRFLQQQQQQ